MQHDILSLLQLHLYTRHKQITSYIPIQNGGTRMKKKYSSNLIDSNQIICTTTKKQVKKNVVPYTDPFQ